MAGSSQAPRGSMLAARETGKALMMSGIHYPLPLPPTSTTPPFRRCPASEAIRLRQSARYPRGHLQGLTRSSRYINDFSKALASEVRILLQEVGKLRDERRALQQYVLRYRSDHRSQLIARPGGV